MLKRDISEGDKQQTKGIRGEQRLNTAKIQGFRKFDKVRYFGKEYFIKGRMSSGYTILMNIEGNNVDFSNLPKGYKTPKLSLCKRISARRSQLICITKIKLFTFISRDLTRGFSIHDKFLAWLRLVFDILHS